MGLWLSTELGIWLSQFSTLMRSLCLGTNVTTDTVSAVPWALRPHHFRAISLTPHPSFCIPLSWCFTGDWELPEVPENSLSLRSNAWPMMDSNGVYMPSPQTPGEASSGVGCSTLAARDSQQFYTPVGHAGELLGGAGSFSYFLLVLPGTSSQRNQCSLKSLSRIKTHVMISQHTANWMNLRTAALGHTTGHTLGPCHPSAAEDTWA